jgi:hypothetical protein
MDKDKGTVEFGGLVWLNLLQYHGQTREGAAALVEKHSDIVAAAAVGGWHLGASRAAALAIMAREGAAGPACDGKYGVILSQHKKFHPDEPVFLFRATDPDAPAAVRDYAARCVQRGCSAEHVDACYAHAARIEAWQAAHPDLVKARAG